MLARLVLLIALITAPLLGLAWKATDEPGRDFEWGAQVREAETILRLSGLTPSARSQITISGEPAAAIYQRPGCPGVLIVVPLPRTAHSFDQVVPGVSGPREAGGFVHRGEVVADYPRWSRWMAALAHDLRLGGDADETVFAFREIGGCGLAESVDWKAGQGENA